MWRWLVESILDLPDAGVMIRTSSVRPELVEAHIPQWIWLGSLDRRGGFRVDLDT
jgi:hypothetical protein